MSTDNIALIDAKALAELLRIGLASVWRWERAGRLPRALHLGQRCTRWRKEEVMAWLAAGSPRRAEWEAMRRPVAG